MQPNSKLIFYCDLDSGGGVLSYTLNIFEIKALPFKRILITHKPKTPLGLNALSHFRKISDTEIIYIPKQRPEKEQLNAIESTLNDIKSGIFFPNYREAPFAACIKAKELGMHTIFVAHGDHNNYYRYAIRYQSVLDEFICPSKKAQYYLKNRLPAYLHNKIHHIPHGVEIPTSAHKFDVERSLSPVKLLYHGRIDFREKNIGALVQIAKELKRIHIDFEIHIAGDGDSFEQLMNEIQNAGLERKILFHGFLQKPELTKLFSECDVSILVSYHEGFCLSLAEAMAHGLPGIAYDCGGVINDYLKHAKNGFIIPFGSPQHFANAVAELASDVEKYQMMSKAAQQTLAGGFSISKFELNYANLLMRAKHISHTNWPAIRSKLPPRSRRSIAGIVDWFGQSILGWPSDF